MAQVIAFVAVPSSRGESEADVRISQRKALRKGGHDRPLRRYEEEDQVQASEDEEKEMSMSPERDIPPRSLLKNRLHKCKLRQRVTLHHKLRFRRCL